MTQENRSSNFVLDVLIVGGALILTDFIGAMAHITFLPWYKPVPSFVTVLAVIFVCTVYAKMNLGRLKYSNVFGYGMKVCAAAAVLVGIYTYFSLKVFFPGLKETAMEQARIVLSQRSDIPEKSMDDALALTERFFIPSAIFGAFFSTLLIAVIGGLISYFFSRPFLRGPGSDLFEDDHSGN